jgi:ApaG protein
LLNARDQLAAAITAEDYLAAAAARDLIKKLEPPKIECVTSSVSEGVRCSIRTLYVPAQSDPQQDFFLFAYEITFDNERQQQVQLRTRHWRIVDSRGHLEQVVGPGVVGKEPVLLPGEVFTYQSFSRLRTKSGVMRGTFTFDVEGGEQLEVHCEFGLDVNGQPVDPPPPLSDM